ncbi:chemotaxis protein CheY [Microbacterium sp. NPDC091313]
MDGVRLAWERVADLADRRATSRALLARLLPGARFSSVCAACGGDHGPVRVAGSPSVAAVAYAGGWAIVAVADGAAAVGVDAEVATVTVHLDRVLAPGAAVRDWVRIEAALKADGRGLRIDPAAVEIDETDDGWLAAVPGRRAPLRGADAAGPPGLIVAVAARG